MTDIVLPKIGFSMTEGTLVEWFVGDGDPVVEGAPLFALDAEKATQEIEAPASGILRIHASAGDSYPVGTILATIE